MQAPMEMSFSFDIIVRAFTSPWQSEHTAPCVGVRFVAPVNESRELVNADPGDALLVGKELRELLNFFRIRLYSLVAGHAFCLSRKGHDFAGGGAGVAGLAFEIEVADVLLMTEGDGLPGGIGGPHCEGNQKE